MQAGVCISEAAERLLGLDPDPAPRVRILGDLLHRPPDDAELAAARDALLGSRAVEELAETQGPGGGWPRFHSMDTRARVRAPTTELAVRRAVQLGLTREHEMLARAERYLERLLSGAEPWPESREPNDRWPAGQQMFVAATLAEVHPDHPQLDPVCETWRRIAERSFASGRYDAADEVRAHGELTGATTMRGSYLVLNNRYALALLGCRERGLSDGTEAALVDWVWSGCGTIRYVDAPLGEPPDRLRGGAVERWFASQAILSRFRSWPARIEETAPRLWSLRDEDGLWDLGPDAGARLSGSWRRRVDRRIDQSIHVLLLLEASLHRAPRAL